MILSACTTMKPEGPCNGQSQWSFLRPDRGPLVLALCSAVHEKIKMSPSGEI